jgi:hypothetical protein
MQTCVIQSVQEHGSIPSTAVEAAPELWRTNLQRYDLSVLGHVRHPPGVQRLVAPS